MNQFLYDFTKIHEEYVELLIKSISPKNKSFTKHDICKLVKGKKNSICCVNGAYVNETIDIEKLLKNGSTWAVKKIMTGNTLFYWELLALISSPAAIQVLRENLSNINWRLLSTNSAPEAIQLLRENPCKIIWSALSENCSPEAIQLLRENLEKIDWSALSRNASSEAIKLLCEYPLNIDWRELCLNRSPEATLLLRQNIKKINWRYLSNNSSPGAIQLLREYSKSSDIDWYQLSFTKPSPGTVYLWRENLDKINWTAMSYNSSPEAIEILRENPDKIDWHIFINYNINFYQIVCPYDYNAIAGLIAPFRQELLEKTWRPILMSTLPG